MGHLTACLLSIILQDFLVLSWTNTGTMGMLLVMMLCLGTALAGYPRYPDYYKRPYYGDNYRKDYYPKNYDYRPDYRYDYKPGYDYGYRPNYDYDYKKDYRPGYDYRPNYGYDYK